MKTWNGSEPISTVSDKQPLCADIPDNKISQDAPIAQSQGRTQLEHTGNRYAICWSKPRILG